MMEQKGPKIISSQQVAATAAKSLQVVTAAMKLKDAFSLEGKL